MFKNLSSRLKMILVLGFAVFIGIIEAQNPNDFPRFPSSLSAQQKGLLVDKIKHYHTLGYTVLLAGPFPPDSPKPGQYNVVVNYPGQFDWVLSKSTVLQWEPGVKIFLEPDIRIRIEGSFSSAYSSFEPVAAQDLYLSAVYEKKMWKGIRSELGSFLRLQNVRLLGADTLIEAPEREMLKIDCISFPELPKCAISIGGRCVTIQDKLCYTLSANSLTENLSSSDSIEKEKEETEEIRNKNQLIKNLPEQNSSINPNNTQFNAKHNSLKKTLLVSTGLGVLGTAVLSGFYLYYHNQALESAKRRDDAISGTDPDRARKETIKTKEWEDKSQLSGYSALTLGVISAGLGITYTFAF